MTDSNAFFRFIWRANALIIFGGALALALGLLVVVGGNVIPWPDDRGLPAPPPEAGTAAPDARAQTKLEVGPFTRADGAVYYAALRRRPAEGAGGVSLSDIKGYRESTTLNVLFFDASSGSVRRLFPDDDGVVVEQVEAIEIGTRSTVRARLYGYVKADTDRDRRLTGADRRRYVLTRPDGSGAVTLAEEAEQLDLAQIASGAQTLSYFIRTGDAVRYGEVDLASFEVRPVRAIEVPKP